MKTIKTFTEGAEALGAGEDFDVEVKFTFPCGTEKVIVVGTQQHKIYGLRLNGKRPIRVDIVGKPHDNLLFKSILKLLHPKNRSVYLNGVEVLKNE